MEPWSEAFHLWAKTCSCDLFAMTQQNQWSVETLLRKQVAKQIQLGCHSRMWGLQYWQKNWHNEASGNYFHPNGLYSRKILAPLLGWQQLMVSVSHVTVVTIKVLLCAPWIYNFALSSCALWLISVAMPGPKDLSSEDVSATVSLYKAGKCNKEILLTTGLA